ncbi:uroporphyrin-III C-m [Calocera cornea HHB12733]|uniref:Uroporphyrin-III C-m n=1 Tax=Calocera cornea HHB12733 TaxID=1353952 RepID=A0A165K4Q7_9BASI|nr:uroporphyrin-III C-m [Calocera cornea HHB12733]
MSILTLPPSAWEPSLPSTSTSTAPYPTPTLGVSLLLSFHPQSRTILIIGSNRLAASRAFVALEAGARVVVVAQRGAEVCEELCWRASQGEVELLVHDGVESEQEMREIVEEAGDVMLVCVTDTLVDDSAYVRTVESATRVAETCRSFRIPITVADTPQLCDFTFPSTYRFPLSPPLASSVSSLTATTNSEPRKSSLQLALTANGQGCRLASRIRRQLIRSLPPSVGDAVEAVGKLRRMARATDLPTASSFEMAAERDEDPSYPSGPLNTPVPQLSASEIEKEEHERTEAARRRMRWVAQVSEYWSLEKLAAMSEGEMRELLRARAEKVPSGEVRRRCTARSKTSGGEEVGAPGVGLSPDGLSQPAASTSALTAGMKSGGISSSNDEMDLASHHSLNISALERLPRQGRILLVGSGPGHPSLLTMAAHTALTKLATVVLSDKLVPSEVLALIPSTTELHIAKKFPGNAEGAQSELIDLALAAARRGETVVRLKQGDPFLYGRGGEELLAFRAAGFHPLIIPGISSALAGPLLAEIPVTQRGVAESVAICTGVGRGGREVDLPSYERSRTTVLLMGVARLAKLVERMLSPQLGYPKNTPIAIIERGSSPDQRVVLSTLEHVVEAVDRSGEARVPGMICVGWACSSMSGEEGELAVLKDRLEGLDRDREDEARIERWLGAQRWKVEEGLSDRWKWVEDLTEVSA